MDRKSEVSGALSQLKRRDAVRSELDANAVAIMSRRQSPRVHNPSVKKAAAAIDSQLGQCKSPYARRAEKADRASEAAKIPDMVLDASSHRSCSATSLKRLLRWTPKSEQGNASLVEHLEKLVAYAPAFISCTYDLLRSRQKYAVTSRLAAFGVDGTVVARIHFAVMICCP